MPLLRSRFIAALLAIHVAPSIPAAEPEPCAVAGYERLRKVGGSNWQAEAGQVLFSELSCAACHQSAPIASPKSPPAYKQGPDLSAAGDRLRAAFIRAYLVDPALVKPGTTMPDLLSGLPEAQKADLIEDLTHHLMGQRAKKRSTVEPVVGSSKTGESLYHSVGCVACHGTQPMPWLAGKYAPGELAKFLLSPLAARPAGRMPDQHLGKKDVAHLAAYLAPVKKGELIARDPEFVVDADRAKRGRKAYLTLGCASCHGKPSENLAPATLADLQAGCLSPSPKAGLPRYALSPEQRDAIRSALAVRGNTATTETAAPEPDARAAIRQILLQRNCYACHVRDGLGGPAADVAVHFTSTKDDLGDLGRLPPPLDGVGRKFQRNALEKILQGRDPVRHYMRVHMPGFGDDLARQLAALFVKADTDPAALEKPVPAHQTPQPDGRNEWGRELVGTGGYACIVCHDINGQPSLGIGAYDLAEMPKRLRPEWMREFLLNPGAFPTGTRMPPFWPQGKPMNPALGGGTTNSQIDSIRRYLAEVDESLPPPGMADRAALVLTPDQRPIVFRTFLKGAGTHAIAVGYPGGMNVAFDALASRWAMAWRGKFLDANGTWNERYIKMEQPLGEALVRLEETGQVVIKGREALKPQYRGHRLGPDRVPVFEYDLGPLHIEDRLEPGPHQGLKQTLRVTGQTTEEVLLLARPPAGVKLQAARGAPLPSRLEFQSGNAELVKEITW